MTPGGNRRGRKVKEGLPAQAIRPKTPKTIVEPKNDAAKVSIDLGQYDTGYRWGESNRNRENPHAVLCRLAEVARMTWSNLRTHNPRYDHACDIERICARAQRQLTAVGGDDCDEFWRLRIGSRGRLWGIRRGSTFYVLWWDPCHEVWPTQPRGT